MGTPGTELDLHLGYSQEKGFKCTLPITVKQLKIWISSAKLQESLELQFVFVGWWSSILGIWLFFLYPFKRYLHWTVKGINLFKAFFFKKKKKKKNLFLWLPVTNLDSWRIFNRCHLSPIPSGLGKLISQFIPWLLNLTNPPGMLKSQKPQNL